MQHQMLYIGLIAVHGCSLIPIPASGLDSAPVRRMLISAYQALRDEAEAWDYCRRSGALFTHVSVELPPIVSEASSLPPQPSGLQQT